MVKSESIIDGLLLSIGSLYSITNLQTVLGIIILVIQIAWLITKIVAKVINAIKNKTSLDTLDNDVGSVVNILKCVLTKKSNKTNDNE